VTTLIWWSMEVVAALEWLEPFIEAVVAIVAVGASLSGVALFAQVMLSRK
jgi:hypothetical protein